jgi:LPS export ABC transporter protein LptC
MIKVLKKKTRRYKFLGRKFIQNFFKKDEYSKKVFVTKSALIIIAAILTGFILIYSSEDTEQKELVLNIPFESTSENIKMAVVNAEFSGTNEKGELYSLFISKGYQEHTNKNIIYFENLEGSIFVSENPWLTFFADAAEFLKKEKKLVLKNNIHIYHSNGYNLETEEMIINLNTSEFKTTSETEFSTKGLNIKSNYLIGKNNNYVKFKDNAKVKFYNY